MLSDDPRTFASILTVTSVLAPFLEEIVFRGFFMTTLTKWLPVPGAVVTSALLFAAAHLSPNDFPQLAALGTVLGITYARTQNLLTPMLIHTFWNSSVLVLLEVLKLNGFDIDKLVR